MEPIISKLQEGVKYPRFERDATTIINDLVEHITKERGVYSSSIEPNPNEHKVWFNTNNNTLNIYENSKWNTISGQGGGGSSSGAIIDNATINNATISRGRINGATLGDINVTSCDINRAYINNANIRGGNIDKAILNDITITSGSINNAIMTRPLISSAAINEGDINNSIFNGGTINGTINAGGVIINAGSKILATCTGSNPMLIPNGGNIGDDSASLTLCGVTLTGGDFTKLKNLQ